VLRLRTRICGNICIEVLAIANTGFIGFEPEIIIPQYILEKILRNPKLESVERILADGSRVVMRRTLDYVEITIKRRTSTTK